MTARHGPLTALGGTSPALAVGDVDMRHVRLTPAGVSWHRGGERRAFVPWADVDALAVDVPRSWGPHPALADWAVSFVETMLGAGGEVREPEPFFAHVSVGRADAELWEIDRHYISGYRRRDARATTRLVELVSDAPGSRALLAQPDAVIARISAILRSS